MPSAADRLSNALCAWLHEDARETIARWRGAPDALTRGAVVDRHPVLFGPRGRELFEEARERGLLTDDVRAAVADWLRDGYAAAGRDRAEERVRALMADPIGHDSDFHAPSALLGRAITEPHVGRRRAIARDLEPWLVRLAEALRSGLADVEEAADRAEWLQEIPPPADDAPRVSAEDARQLLSATDDVWAELGDRLAHAAKAPLEHWTDLAHALRAPGLDDRFDAARRWRRLAAHLRPLGLEEPLSTRARAEATAASLLRPRGALAVVHVPRDVRVTGGLELGLAAERHAAIALGRALSITLTNPALPAAVARPRSGTVGRAIGGLLAHLHADPLFCERALALGGAEQRAVRELALGLELWSLRTEAARAALAPEGSAGAFADHAREALRGAWGVDPGRALACALALPLGGHPDASLRASRWVPALHVALRDRFDEDWWRNPRAAEPLRAAMARGATLTVEAWTEELGARADHTVDRLRELAA